jgi:hypothetical protein
MSVVLIYDEDVTLLGVAKNYKAAIDFLLNKGYLSDSIQIYDQKSNHYIRIDEYYGKNWLDVIRDEWDVENFNEFFRHWLWLDEWDIIGE